MEKEAYDFAGAFLMPRRDIAPFFRVKSVGIPLLAQLKLSWKVAMQAIVMRAFHIGAITAHQKKLLFINFSKKGYRRREPEELDFPREHPKLFPALLQGHQEDLGYSLDDMAEILRISKTDLCSWYGLCENATSKDRSHLRVIG